MRIKPDNHYANPIGWAATQLGHLCLGILACFWFAWIWRFFAGELPYAWICVAAWAVAYLAIELPQKGGFFDTLEDILWAVVISAAVVIWTRDVFAVAERLFDSLTPIMGTITILLAAGFGPRLWQAHKIGRTDL